MTNTPKSSLTRQDLERRIAGLLDTAQCHDAVQAKLQADAARRARRSRLPSLDLGRFMEGGLHLQPDQS